MNKIIYFVIVCFALPQLSLGANFSGRLGIGMSNQLVNGVPALSVKLQKSRSSALGFILGLKSSEGDTNYGAGLKYYQYIYDEPNLTFYGLALLALQSYQFQGETLSGHQLDFGMGSEFHLQGIENIGFSFEFGLSIHEAENKSVISTFGDSFVKSSIHFYI